jgi:hypothetical protein
MTFKITVSRQPFAVEFETSSVSEAIGVFQVEESEFAKLFELKFGAQEGQGDAPAAPAAPETNEQTKERKERKPRGPNKPKPEAVAPAPIVIPGAEAPPTAPEPIVTPDVPALVVAPPPPPAPIAAPPAPPAIPAAPPTGILAGKIAAELDRRATGAVDQGQGLADWLVACGICVKGATYKEAIDVLRFEGDEKLGPIAAQLGVG